MEGAPPDSWQETSVIDRASRIWRIEGTITNQWTVLLEWNGGMKYWNDPFAISFLKGVCNGSESLRV